MKNACDKYHNKGGKEKSANYCAANKDVLKEDAKNWYRNLTDKQKNINTKYQRERYRNNDLNERLKQYQRTIMLQKKKNEILFFCTI